MKINAISKVLIASFALSGAVTVSSCSSEHQAAARNRAAKYLTGEEYNKAIELEDSISIDRENYGDISNYWDTLLISCKAKEAYEKGRQMVRDSLAGNLNEVFHKPEYTKMDLEDIKGKRFNLYKESQITRKEVSKFYTGEEFQKLLEKEPELNSVLSGFKARIIHFWNKIALKGAMRDAYNRGANDERAKAATKSLEVDEVSALK